MARGRNGAQQVRAHHIATDHEVDWRLWAGTFDLINLVGVLANGNQSGRDTARVTRVTAVQRRIEETLRTLD